VENIVKVGEEPEPQLPKAVPAIAVVLNPSHAAPPADALGLFNLLALF